MSSLQGTGQYCPRRWGGVSPPWYTPSSGFLSCCCTSHAWVSGGNNVGESSYYLPCVWSRKVFAHPYYCNGGGASHLKRKSVRHWFLIAFSSCLEYFDECVTLFQYDASQYDTGVFCGAITTPTHGAGPCSERRGWINVFDVQAGWKNLFNKICLLAILCKSDTYIIIII